VWLHALNAYSETKDRTVGLRVTPGKILFGYKHNMTRT
jgi:hypothetical protein